jgi:hypothetical protein
MGRSVIVGLSGKLLIDVGGRGGSRGFSAACKEIGSIEGGKMGFGGGGGTARTSCILTRAGSCLALGFFSSCSTIAKPKTAVAWATHIKTNQLVKALSEFSINCND